MIDTQAQWEYFLQNVGVWEGSYITYTMDGRVINEIPSCCHVETLNNQQHARTYLKRDGFPDLKLEFSVLPKNIIYHQDGSYSQGKLNYAAYDDFACEFGLIHGSRRMRGSVLFDVVGYPGRVILIPEYQKDTEKSKSIKRFGAKDLLGKWEGFGTTIYLDGRPEVKYTTTVNYYIDEYQRLAQDEHVNGYHWQSSAQIKGQLLLFDNDSERIQKVVLLPGGASLSFPAKLQMRKPVYLEMAWLVEPYIRHRITRYYNQFGEWQEVSLVIEKKVG